MVCGPALSSPVGANTPGNDKRMHGRHQRGEQITAGEQAQSVRARQLALAEQKYCRDQIVDQQRRLIDRNECRHRQQRHLGERRQDEKNHGRGGNDRVSESALATAGGQARQDVRPLLRLQRRSLQSRHNGNFRHSLGIATQGQRRRQGAVARDKRFLAHILHDSGHGTNRNRQKFYWSFRDTERRRTRMMKAMFRP